MSGRVTSSTITCMFFSIYALIYDEYLNEVFPGGGYHFYGQHSILIFLNKDLQADISSLGDAICFNNIDTVEFLLSRDIGKIPDDLIDRVIYDGI